MIFSEKTFSIPLETACVIADEYISWTKGEPICANYDSDESLFCKSTAENIYRFLISDSGKLNFAEELIKQSDTFLIEVSKCLYGLIFKKPYIWAESIDIELCNKFPVYEKYIKEKYFEDINEFNTPGEEISVSDFLRRCNSFREAFCKYFYRNVIIPLRKKFAETNKEEGRIWFTESEFKRLKTEEQEKIKMIEHLHKTMSTIEASLKSKIDFWKFSFISIIISLLIIIPFSGVIGYVSAKSVNVDTIETKSQFDININNPEDKNVNLNISH